MVNNTVKTYCNMAAIQINQETGAQFKDEKKAPLKGKEFQKDLIFHVFNAYAGHLGKQVERKEEQKGNKIKATFFHHVAKAVGSTEAEVRKRIKAYIKENKLKVLDIARQISTDAGMELSEITSDDFASLISCKDPEHHKKGAFRKFLRDKQGLTPLHIANYTLAHVVAEVFEINVTLRDLFISYDDIFGGMLSEQVRIDVTSSGNEKHLELMQGWSIMSSALSSAEIYHIRPVALVNSK